MVRSEPRIRVSVLIAGGGPVGLTLAALLGRYGLATCVIEADASYCEGSRAICISRRSQEIFGWLDADRALCDIGLPWHGGRSYYRDAEVLHFRMPSEPTERFAPMLNIQQYHVEAIAHRAGQACAERVDVHWSSRVATIVPGDGFVDVDVIGPDGSTQTFRADWLVACDGGRSTVREASGLAFEGVQYEGRYVIVDIEQATARPVERLAWFDPPSNPGSTILMHRQPGNVWRIDYQIADDEDAGEAVRPENVLPRVQSHLQMIGETAPWRPLWISIYNAKCLTLRDYRHGRVLFAGDAAHLVPIFGVRGLNSGLDDAGNLAWKLALVVSGQADEALLDSYSSERVDAARQNIAYGAKSTEFMAPPHPGFALMREAALRLATEYEPVRSLINPRQTAPIRYAGSPLNAGAVDDHDEAPARAGDVAPEAQLAGRHLSTLFGRGFVALLFGEVAVPRSLQASGARSGSASLTAWRIRRSPGRRGEGVDAAPQAPLAPADRDAAASTGNVLVDDRGQAWDRYAAAEGTVVLVRPDGYILGRWTGATADAGLAKALAPYRRPGQSTGRAAPATRLESRRQP